jgi:hypothetical protein
MSLRANLAVSLTFLGLFIYFNTLIKLYTDSESH